MQVRGPPIKSMEMSSLLESSCAENTPAILDLLVIGAGPHALSLLTRLIDDDPDLMTESQRSHCMSKAKFARPKIRVREHLKKTFHGQSSLPNTLVVDSLGHWMAQWSRDFQALGIHHLRSHEHMHCCPFDFQSLQVWAETQGREAELKPMEHIDRDACRKKGYYGPFVVPGSKLFLDFSHSLVERYGLAPLISRGTVKDIRIMTVIEGSSFPRLFEVILDDGRCLITRKVVSAIGPGPAWRVELP